MEKNSIILVTVIAFCFLGVFYTISQDKTAFVYVNRVMEQYQRMIDAQLELEYQAAALRDFISSADNSLNDERAHLAKLKTENSLSNQEIATIELSLKSIEADLQLKKNLIPRQFDSLRSVIIGPVVNEINAYIEVYGKDNGLDYVFGNLGNGNIMYGHTDNDITQNIVRDLNDHYAQLRSRTQ